MRQSTIIFGTLLAAFVIYITLRGQLPAYLGLFTSSTTGGTGGPSNNESEEGPPLQDNWLDLDNWTDWLNNWNGIGDIK